ncbi:ribosomal protein S12 methylthiotransferase accessory factor [Micromonospora matsumotoense]|uniref:Ribosomal protein S12 methylthiotransferase accessory factor n=1 Tax=Micromonospora matsumotoense TaxID=121616 RepID=A0A1C4Z7G6_9ACTN|nr:TOMM precursor leader peptide-binding protein [Micromonospora matsumotoense]SCF28814.1 ribosomal protein S12 methylthiotransferase accessory factor [Micromonospora matsumotoense]
MSLPVIDPGRRITEALGALLTAPDEQPLAVHPLGVRDERAADVAAPPARVLVYGRHALLAPQPGRAGCACCLARRWQAVRPPEMRDALELGGETTPVGDWPYAIPFVGDALRALTAAVDTAGPDTGPPAVYHLDVDTLQVGRVLLLADADCPVCGQVEWDAARAPELAASPKRAPDSFRARDATEYPLSPTTFVNPVCGPLGAALWPDLTSTSTSPVHGVFQPRSGKFLREMLFGGHADGYARSVRLGLLEGLERAAGLRPVRRRTAVVATLDELGADALDPRVCGSYTDEFYRVNRHIRRFAPDRAIAWVWGWSMRDQRPILVPEVLVYYHSAPLQERFVQENSSGCASGGSLVEAIYHGLMEAVERDAFMLAWYGRRPLPEIDPATSSRLQTRLMVDRLAMYGYRARFFDTRCTFDFPVVTGVAERVDGGFGTLAFGGGASLDPETALAAALCEIASDSVLAGIRAAADEPRLREMVDDYDKVWRLHDHPLLYGLPEMRRHTSFLLDSGSPARPVSEVYAGLHAVHPLGDDLRDDLDRCVRTVAACGFDVIVVDQTTPEQHALGLHTASVTVPGLLPIDFGWQRQRALNMPRLRTAHHRAGLVDHDLRDDEIHLVPHPYP